MTKTVKVYDFETEQASEIPEAELAPRMVQANVKGVGLVWVDATKLKIDGQFQHPPFDEELRKMLAEQIMEPLEEVFPMSLQAWEEGFRKDHNAEREMAIWIHIARTFAKYLEDKNFSHQERQEVFNVLSSCATSGPDSALTVVHLEYLTREQAKEIAALFFPKKK